jgi:hypothetical protein
MGVPALMRPRPRWPEYLEPTIRLEAMIDARIDKALARLVSLQEQKRVRVTYSLPLAPLCCLTSTLLRLGQWAITNGCRV